MRLLLKRQAEIRAQPQKAPPPMRPGSRSGRMTSSEAEISRLDGEFRNATNAGTLKEQLQAAARLRGAKRASRG
jgi:hypothetical protein